MRSTAPGSLGALMVNHGRTVNIALEDGIYKVAAVKQMGAVETSGAGAVNKQLTPVRRRLAAHTLAVVARRCICQYAGRSEAALTIIKRARLKGDIPYLRLFVPIKCIPPLLTHPEHAGGRRRRRRGQMEIPSISSKRQAPLYLRLSI